MNETQKTNKTTCENCVMIHLGWREKYEYQYIETILYRLHAPYRLLSLLQLLTSESLIEPIAFATNEYIHKSS